MLFHFIQEVLPTGHELSDSTRKNLVFLDKRRRNLQKRIGELNQSFTAIHAKCDGSCCREKTEYYFTGADFWLRKFSLNTIESFGVTSARPWQFFIKKRFRRVMHRSDYMDRRKMEQRKNVEKCNFLGQKGCTLDAENRPIKCIIATCSKLRQAMDKRTKTEYKNLISELYNVSLSTLQILKKEAGISPLSGRVSLLLAV
jgi:hypothetical protein